MEEIKPGKIILFNKQVASISESSNFLEFCGVALEVCSVPEFKEVSFAENEKYLCVEVKNYSSNKKSWVLLSDIKNYGELSKIMTIIQADKVAKSIWDKYESKDRKMGEIVQEYYPDYKIIWLATMNSIPLLEENKFLITKSLFVEYFIKRATGLISE